MLALQLEHLRAATPHSRAPGRAGRGTGVCGAEQPLPPAAQKPELSLVAYSRQAWLQCCPSLKPWPLAPPVSFLPSPFILHFSHIASDLIGAFGREDSGGGFLLDPQNTLLYPYRGVTLFPQSLEIYLFFSTPGKFPRVRDSLDKIGGNRASSDYCLWFGGSGHEVLVPGRSSFLELASEPSCSLRIVGNCGGDSCLWNGRRVCSPSLPGI